LRTGSRRRYYPRARPRGGIPATPEPAASLWRHRDFLKLWAGQTISVFGSQFTGVALPIVAVLALAATPAQMGLLNAFGTLPFLLFGLIVGVWIDRWPRRPVLILGDVGRGVVVLGIAALAVLGLLRMEYLYLTAFATGVLSVFFDVAYQAYIPSLVGRTQLVDANGKMEASRAASQVAGPSVGGVVIQVLSAPFAMVFDALTFFASGGFLAAIRKKEPPPGELGRSSMWREAREGLGTVFGDDRLRAIAGCTATANLFGSAFFALYVLFILDAPPVGLGVSPAALGLVFGLGSLGALVGALVAGRLARRFGVGRVIVAGAAGFGLGAVPIVFATPPLAVPLLIGAQWMFGISTLVYNINQVSLRQAVTPHRLQGRMNATMRFLVWGTLPIGAILGGVLGEAIGLRTAMGLAAVGAELSVLWILFSPVRSVREMPAVVAD